MLDGVTIAWLPDSGVVTFNGTASFRLNGGGFHLFTGLSSGVHTVVYSVATVSWDYSTQYSDVFTTDPNLCRLLLTSF